MQVTQPNEFYKGLPKEDVFFVKDDQNNPVGEGFLIYQYQPTIFPSRPVNIYFSMTSKPEGEYWLLGSLAARARCGGTAVHSRGCAGRAPIGVL